MRFGGKKKYKSYDFPLEFTFKSAILLKLLFNNQGIKFIVQPFETPETIKVDHHADGISCDGGNPELGHPKVWYNFDGEDSVECRYCDRVFIKA